MAKLILKNNAYKIESVAEHSHEADPVDLGKRRVCKEALLIIMENRKMGPRDVYNQVNDKLSPEDSVIAAIDYANLSDLIAKARKDANNYPPGARNFQDVEIPEGWEYFADNSLFVFHIDPPSKENRMLILSPDYMLKILGESKIIACDGTFCYKSGLFFYHPFSLYSPYFLEKFKRR